jgi:hypothetical protein
MCTKWFLSWYISLNSIWYDIMKKKKLYRILKKFQISFADTAKATARCWPQYGLCTLYFWCHKCTHFAWISYTAVKSKWLFVDTSAHTLLGPVCHTLCTQTSGARTVLGSTVLIYTYILFQPLFSMGLCSVYNCTVQIYTC